MNFGDVPVNEINPFDIVKEIKNLIWEKPESVSSNKKYSVTIKAKNKDQSQKIQNFTKGNGKPYVSSLHPRFNISKRLVFLTEFVIDDSDLFRDELKEKCGIIDMETSPFIKTKYAETRAFAVTFQEEELPHKMFWLPQNISDE